MTELLYDVDAGRLALMLLAGMLALIEAGYRLGRRRAGALPAGTREHINGIQSAMLGVLALLLGFTFSLALQRYDSRADAVVDEANAIGTAWLRTQLLPAPLQASARLQLRDYLDLRLRTARQPLPDAGAQDPARPQAGPLQQQLWDAAVSAAQAAPQSQPAALYLASLNEMFDSQGRRDASVRRHVPELALWLLALTFLIAGATVGYACGVAGHRPSLASLAMVTLIVVLVFIILDLDRPRRGLIQVTPTALQQLRDGMDAPPRSP